MALLTQAASTLTFSMEEVIKFLGFAFVVGGLFMQVRFNGKRIDTIESKSEKALEALQTSQKEALSRIESRFSERQDAADQRHSMLETRFLHAIETFGQKIGDLATKLEVVVVQHEARFDMIEAEQERNKE